MRISMPNGIPSSAAHEDVVWQGREMCLRAVPRQMHHMRKGGYAMLSVVYRDASPIHAFKLLSGLRPTRASSSDVDMTKEGQCIV